MRSFALCPPSSAAGLSACPANWRKLHKIHRAKSKEAHSRSYEPLGPVLKSPNSDAR
jgi:hypothetical protein